MTSPSQAAATPAFQQAAGRVLILASEFPPGPGGIGTHAHQVALGLHQVGWEVLVLASQDYVTEREVAEFNGAQPFDVVRFRSVPGPALEALYRGAVLARRIRSFSPDVIVASGSRPVLLAGARLSGRHVPLVAMGHGTEFGVRGGWQARALRIAFGRASAVVCVSEFTREQMHLAGIRLRQEHVIPNGADPGRFRLLPDADPRTIRSELGLPGGPLIVTVGNVTERKGQDIVVRALPSIRESKPEVQYAIVGMPTRGEEIRDLAARLGVSGCVHLLGRLDEVRLVRLLNAADLFVMTSRHTRDGDFEGYGIAVIEAALCGVPSVVAGGSGLAEAVDDGRTGLCVSPENPGATAEAIRRLLDDDVLRAKMGEAARLRAEREQTWAGRIADYDRVLQELVRR
ncbi:MAG TPA: glycosyltransferase family 4 protein [Thermoanaerobaculia bacterium]|jgi:phosphatidylinositol alpha-1,6-mannosyltransferase|nr:glycosyltransferase family 4 protein [Thermoanaerobaculia bacterium]